MQTRAPKNPKKFRGTRGQAEEAPGQSEGATGAGKNTLKHAERGGPRGTIQRQQSPPLIS